MTYEDIDKNWEIYIEKDSFTLGTPRNDAIIGTVAYMHHFTCDRFTRIVMVEERTGKLFFNTKRQWKCNWCKCAFPGEPEKLKEQISKYIFCFDLVQLNI